MTQPTSPAALAAQTVPKLILVTPETLQLLVDAMGRADHGSEWDYNKFPNGEPYVWTGKALYAEKYRLQLKHALPILGFEV